MSTSVVLLDPLRSALVSMAIDEGLLVPPREVDLQQTPAFRLGKSHERRAAVMELMLLHDSLRIIHHEKPGDTEALRAKGLHALSLLPLRATGLLEFDGRPPTDTGIVLQEGGSASEYWKVNRHVAEPWAPVLAEYVFAKGHAASLDIARKYCQQIVDGSAEIDVDYDPLFHFSMMSTLGELLQAECISEQTGASCSQPLISHRPDARDVSADHRVLQIVIDELLANEFSLPVPATLQDALRLQGDPNVREFRGVFNPWIATLRNGTLANESRLRSEVRRALRAFRNVPRVKRLNKLLAYIAIPVGLVTIPEAVVAGTAIGVSAIGLGALAERWHKKSKWLGLARSDA